MVFPGLGLLPGARATAEEPMVMKAGARKRRRKSWEGDVDEFKKVLGSILDVFNEHRRPIQAVIPEEMFKKMLFLCHPDKHNNHEWAKEITQWLLEQRKRSV